jgi:hypothetical protein
MFEGYEYSPEQVQGKKNNRNSTNSSTISTTFGNRAFY